MFNLFKKEIPKKEKEYRVLPTARKRALDNLMSEKKKRLGPLNLKKDLSSYMTKHSKDKLDTRKHSASSVANDLRAEMNRRDISN